jgi:1-acyl-sn-glycerol-3-phosphate acyltransferase
MTGGTDREAPRAPSGDGPTPPGSSPPGRSGVPVPTSSPPDAIDPAAPTAPDSAPADPAVPTPGDRALADPADPAVPSTPTGPGGGRGRNPDRGYLIAAVVVKPLMRTWFRIRLEGEEHIPGRGPVILASNHRSNMDPVLLASAVRRPVAFMAKAELFVGPLAWVLRWIGQFPVRRGGIDREALRRTDAILDRGGMLGVFPEGTRGDGSFTAVHPGLAYIMVRQRCPVVPVAIFGTERVRRRFGWLPFASPVRIVIGPPIDLPQSTSDRAGRRVATQILHRRLQEFLAAATGPSARRSPHSKNP